MIRDVGGGVAPSQCEMLTMMLQSLLLVVLAVVDSVAESEDRDALDANSSASRVWPATGAEVFFFGFTEVGFLLFAGLEFDGGTAAICRRALPTGRNAS